MLHPLNQGILKGESDIFFSQESNSDFTDGFVVAGHICLNVLNLRIFFFVAKPAKQFC